LDAEQGDVEADDKDVDGDEVVQDLFCFGAGLVSNSSGCVGAMAAGCDACSVVVVVVVIRVIVVIVVVVGSGCHPE